MKREIRNIFFINYVASQIVLEEKKLNANKWFELKIKRKNFIKILLWDPKYPPIYNLLPFWKKKW